MITGSFDENDRLPHRREELLERMKKAKIMSRLLRSIQFWIQNPNELKYLIKTLRPFVMNVYDPIEQDDLLSVFVTVFHRYSCQRGTDSVILTSMFELLVLFFKSFMYIDSESNSSSSEFSIPALQSDPTDLSIPNDPANRPILPSHRLTALTNALERLLELGFCAQLTLYFERVMSESDSTELDVEQTMAAVNLLTTLLSAHRLLLLQQRSFHTPFAQLLGISQRFGQLDLLIVLLQLVEKKRSAPWKAILDAIWLLPTFLPSKYEGNPDDKVEDGGTGKMRPSISQPSLQSFSAGPSANIISLAPAQSSVQISLPSFVGSTLQKLSDYGREKSLLLLTAIRMRQELDPELDKEARRLMDTVLKPLKKIGALASVSPESLFQYKEESMCERYLRFIKFLKTDESKPDDGKPEDESSGDEKSDEIIALFHPNLAIMLMKAIHHWKDKSPSRPDMMGDLIAALKNCSSLLNDHTAAKELPAFLLSLVTKVRGTDHLEQILAMVREILEAKKKEILVYLASAKKAVSKPPPDPLLWVDMLLLSEKFCKVTATFLVSNNSSVHSYVRLLRLIVEVSELQDQQQSVSSYLPLSWQRGLWSPFGRYWRSSGKQSYLDTKNELDKLSSDRRKEDVLAALSFLPCDSKADNSLTTSPSPPQDPSGAASFDEPLPRTLSGRTSSSRK